MINNNLELDLTNQLKAVRKSQDQLNAELTATTIEIEKLTASALNMNKCLKRLQKSFTPDVPADIRLRMAGASKEVLIEN